MTDLTEKWKKGKIPEAWYYVKDIHNKESLDRYFKETDNFEYLEDWEVDEVLAEVPSYEEWQELKSKLQLKETEYDFDTARLEEENAQLKELLRECLAHLTIGKYGTSVTPLNILCDEVEEVLK